MASPSPDLVAAPEIYWDLRRPRRFCRAEVAAKVLWLTTLIVVVGKAASAAPNTTTRHRRPTPPARRLSRPPREDSSGTVLLQLSRVADAGKVLVSLQQESSNRVADSCAGQSTRPPPVTNVLPASPCFFFLASRTQMAYSAEMGRSLGLRTRYARLAAGHGKRTKRRTSQGKRTVCPGQ